MEKSQFEIPKSAVLMVSPRDYRLSSLNGYCMLFKAGVPVKVPPVIYAEAVRAGISMVEGQEMPEAPKDPEPRKGAEEADRLEAEAKESALKTALTVLITRNDPQDFKADGTPKALKVIAELSPEIPRPTATEISEAYQALQENLDLAED